MWEERLHSINIGIYDFTDPVSSYSSLDIVKKNFDFFEMEVEELFSIFEINGTELFISKISSKIIQLFISTEEKNFNLIDSQFELLNQLLKICEKENGHIGENEQVKLLKLFNFGLEFLNNANIVLDALLTFLGVFPMLTLFDDKVKSASLTSIQNILQKFFANGNSEKNILKFAEKCVFLQNQEIANQIFMMVRNLILPNATDLYEFDSYLYIFGNAAKFLLKTSNSESIIVTIIDTIKTFYSELSKLPNSVNKMDSNQCAKSLKFLDLVFEFHGVIENIEVCENIKSEFVDVIFRNYITWCIFQLGISHKDSYSRKLCVTMLRYAVNTIKNSNKECIVSVPNSAVENKDIVNEIFTFKPHSASFLSKWGQFLSICEALEEGQIHVVQPFFSKFETLFADDLNSLQTCWLLCLLRRMFTHENKTVQKEGFLYCLKLNQSRFRIMNTPLSIHFLCHHFVEMSKDENLYNLPTVENNSTNNEQSVFGEVPSKLQQFLVGCYDNYHDKADFLNEFILNVSQHHWSSVSLVYVCQSLENFSPNAAWTGVEIAAVRKLITTCIATHHPVLRKVIARLLISCTVKFIRSEKIDVFEVVKILVLCVEDEIISRNSPLWKKVATWLVDNIQDILPIASTGEVNKFLLKRMNDISSHPSIDDSSLKESYCLVLFIILFVDGSDLNLDCEVGQKLLAELITGSVTNIEKAITHLYASQTKAFYSVCVIKIIFKLFNTTLASNKENDMTKEFLITSSSKIFTSVTEYVTRKIPFICQNISNSKPFFNLLDEMLKFVSQNCPVAIKKRVMATLVTMVTCVFKTSLNFIKKSNNMEKITLEGLECLLASLFATRWCCKVTFELNLKIDSSVMSQFKEFVGFLDLNGKTLSQKHSPEIANKTWGLKMGEFLNLQWSFVEYSFKFNLSLVDPLTTISYISDVLEILNGKSLLTVYGAAYCLLMEIHKTSPSQLQSNEVFDCLKTLWKTTHDLINSSLFRTLYQSFVSTIFQPCILSASEGSELLSCVNEILQDILELSKSKPGLIYPIVKSCKEYWMRGISGTFFQNEDKKINFTNGDCKTETLNEKPKLLKFLNNSSVFIKSVEKHDQYALKSMHNFTELFFHCLTYIPASTKNSKSIHQAIQFSLKLKEEFAPSLHSDNDEISSLIATSILLNLNPENINDFDLGNHILHQLLELDANTSQAKSRYHANSSHHFLKQKIWQNIFVLLPFIKQEEGCGLAESLMCCLTVDMQASVRHLIEWILTLVVYRFPQAKKVLLEKLRTNTLKGSTHISVCSCLTVVLLLGVAWRHKYNHNELGSYFLELVDLAIPWCMTQHFSVRLYAHAVLLRIKLIFDQEDEADTLNLHCPSLNKCLLFADNSLGNVVKNWTRIKENFMMFYLDPVLDISLENIFVNLPRLCLTEVAGLDLFNRVLTTDSWLPFKCSRKVLSELNATNWVAHSNNKPQQFGHSQPVSNADNVQKKIVTKSGNEDKAKQGSLILIASLIDKASNLGGLARTCEIFGAEKLIVNSLSCIEDKLFQSLSVTAHKWLKMEEVKAWKLEEYLIFLKSKGYQLIGTEQTEQSKNLADFKFPVKCALLLGNEKEGIQPNLLRLLDCCIEIPQVGVVRSLNVHVSGAIAVWEYSKQNIFNSRSTDSG